MSAGPKAWGGAPLLTAGLQGGGEITEGWLWDSAKSDLWPGAAEV